MNYEEMSDKHLSKLVAESIGLTVGDNLSMLRNNSSATVHDGDGYWLEFSINNPADMWPIILQNKIWIQPDMVGDGYWYCYDCEEIATAKDKNPLRAAAIVFLMMKDAEKVK